jgi:hypothetical protein
MYCANFMVLGFVPAQELAIKGYGDFVEVYNDFG